MIRLIVRRAATCPDGVCLGNDYHTLDIECQELERFIAGNDNAYSIRTVIGAEVITPPSKGATHE